MKSIIFFIIICLLSSCYTYKPTKWTVIKMDNKSFYARNGNTIKRFHLFPCDSIYLGKEITQAAQKPKRL